jgi:pimeloyl-ACP methyl ester carboxylesterase/DNA-binding CsgD family transcriptional regulator
MEVKMNAPPVSYVTTSDGYSIAYIDTGSGEPFIFLPTFFNHVSEHWTNGMTAPALLGGLAERFRLINFDSRGMGMSTRGLPSNVSFEDYLLDLDAVTERLKLDRFILLGSCSTAFLAAHYAARHPERVRALILVNGALSWDSWRLSAIYDDLPAQDWQLFLQSFVPLGVDPDKVRSWVERVQGWMEQCDYLASVPAWKQAGVEGILDRIQAPTLVLHSRRFRLRSMEAPLELARRLTDARLEILDSNRLFGEPGQAIDAIDRFIAGLPRERSDQAVEAGTLSGLHGLPPRQLQVLRLIADGKTNGEIADELVISLRTVERHVAELYARLGVRNRVEAAAFAISHLAG